VSIELTGNARRKHYVAYFWQHETQALSTLRDANNVSSSEEIFLR